MASVFLLITNEEKNGECLKTFKMNQWKNYAKTPTYNWNIKNIPKKRRLASLRGFNWSVPLMIDVDFSAAQATIKKSTMQNSTENMLWWDILRCSCWFHSIYRNNMKQKLSVPYFFLCFLLWFLSSIDDIFI